MKRIDVRTLGKYINMITDYIEEPHSLPKEWVELLVHAREMFENEASEHLRKIGGYDK